jgi:glutaredoxin-like protein NrdH
MVEVTVYTNPSCVQCDQTKRYLDRVGIPYSVVDLATNEEAAEMVIAKGHKSAPVVITDKDEWSGFNLVKLSNLSERFTSEG